MRAFRVESAEGLSSLKRVELPEPRPGPGEVLVRLRASSLNYRDLGILKGGYRRNQKRPVIPLSDGAGEVVDVGPGVHEFRSGDHVAGCFLQGWLGGPISERTMHAALGGGVDGVLSELRVFPEHGLVHAPKNLDFEQAACLPCAALTAWAALTEGGLEPGQTVLALGTGGVSIFALQFAKAAGARVIITSSSDEKLAKARRLGADETINYRREAEWDKVVRERTGGEGVDHVLEVGGPGTFEKSLAATRVGGTVSLIGLLSGAGGQASPMTAMFNRLTVRGIYVGSRRQFEGMNRAIEINDLRPVIDRVFSFDEAPAAYERLDSGTHVGKIVIRHDA